MTAVALPAGPVSPEVGLAHQFCAYRADTGPCRASLPRFFFNVLTGQCEAFVYGGCRGNENRFGSREECRQRCLAGAAGCCPGGDTPSRRFHLIRDLILLETNKCPPFYPFQDSLSHLHIAGIPARRFQISHYKLEKACLLSDALTVCIIRWKK